jgi:hypothetical protein
VLVTGVTVDVGRRRCWAAGSSALTPSRLPPTSSPPNPGPLTGTPPPSSRTHPSSECPPVNVASPTASTPLHVEAGDWGGAAGPKATADAAPPALRTATLPTSGNLVGKKVNIFSISSRPLAFGCTNEFC